MNLPLGFAAICYAASLLLSASALAETKAAHDPKLSAAIAAGSNAFGADLYHRLAAEKGNLFFSPYSIDSALTMVYGGARGETAAEMARVLQFKLDADAIHPACSGLIKTLTNPADVGGAPSYKLAVANALYGQIGYPFQDAYLKLARESYGAPLNLVDYSTAAARQDAADTINQWVEKQTNNKIKDLVKPAIHLDEATRLVLVNAIYFKSAWAHEFVKEATRDEPFHVSPDAAPAVPMMHQKRRHDYFENEDLQAVELPYRGRELSMLLIVPRKADGLAGLEKQLTSEKMAEWAGELKPREVDLFVPRFKITGEFELADQLQAMGMKRAFSQKAADFSGMASVERLYITKVIHKAYVDVNEEGTEAAAATAVVMGKGLAMVRPEEPVVLRADRPFVFVIGHRASGAVLFMGRLADPR